MKVALVRSATTNHFLLSDKLVRLKELANENIIIDLYIGNSSGARPSQYDYFGESCKAIKFNHNVHNLIEKYDHVIVDPTNCLPGFVTYYNIHKPKNMYIMADDYTLKKYEFDNPKVLALNAGIPNSVLLNYILPLEDMNTNMTLRSLYVFDLPKDEVNHELRNLYNIKGFLMKSPMSLPFHKESKLTIKHLMKNTPVGIRFSDVEWSNHWTHTKYVFITRPIGSYLLLDILESRRIPVLVDCAMNDVCIDKYNCIHTGRYYWYTMKASQLQITDEMIEFLKLQYEYIDSNKFKQLLVKLKSL